MGRLLLSCAAAARALSSTDWWVLVRAVREVHSDWLLARLTLVKLTDVKAGIHELAKHLKHCWSWGRWYR